MSDIGVKLGVEGEAEFKKALNQINGNLKTLGTEMKAVTSAYDKNDKSVEALTAQNDVLNKRIDTQKEKLAELTAGLEKARVAYGESDAQTQKLQQDVNLTTAALNNSEAQLRKNNEALDAYAEESKKAIYQTEEFKTKTKEMGESLKNTGDKISGVGKTLSVGITAPIAAAGAASYKFAADLQDAMGASDQIFKDASESVKTWADELNSYYGIAESDALSYANTMGAMLQNIGGLTEEEAAKQSQTLVQLAGDLAAMFGGSTQSAVQALTGALKGNNSMLDNYGMGVNEATIKTKALEMGLISEGEQLDLASKQAATLALIMEQTADAQGQAAREADGASGSMRALQTELKNISTDIGEVLLPIITPFLTSISEMVKQFGQLSPEAQKIIIVIAGLAAAVGPLLIIVGKVITAVGAITTALPALGTAFTALTGPVGLAIGIVAALAAGLITLWNTNETFRENVTMAWELVKNAAIGLLGTVTKVFTVDIPAAFSAVVSFVQTNWQGLLLLLVNPIAGAVKLLYELNPQFKQWVDDLWNNFKEWVGKFVDIGKDIVRGVWNGIASMGKWFKEQVSGFFGGIVGGVKSLLGIASPSKVFAGIGENMAAGLGVGFAAQMRGVAKQINDSIPTRFDSPTMATRTVEGAVNGMAALMGAQGGGNYTINVMLPDGKALASVVFDPIRGIAKQRGVALA